MSTQSVNQDIIVCPHCSKLNRVASSRPFSQARCGACQAALATASPVEISGKSLARLAAHDQGQFLVDVWAPWCQPCLQFAPVFAAAAETYRDHVRFFKINADDHGAALQPFGIRGIPTLLAWSSGQLVSQRAGALPKPQFFQWIEHTFALTSPS